MYAVDEKNLRCINKGKYPAVSSTSSEDSDDSPPKTKAKTDIIAKSIGKDVKELKDSLMSLFAIQKNMKVPVALRRVVCESFNCTICQGIITPPAIFSRCCRNLIGCEECVDKWFEDRTRTCPHCRQERGLSEIHPVKGLDEFLRAMKTLFEE